MRNFRTFVTGASVRSAVAIGLVLAAVHARAGESTKDVNVVNTPTVNVGNPVLVDILDSPLEVLSAGTVPAAPFQATVTIRIAAGSQNGNATLPAVPAGQRLVIEYVSAYGEVDDDQTVNRISLTTTLSRGNGSFTSAQHYFPVTSEGDSGSGGRHVFSAGENVRLYSEGGPVLFSAGAYRGGNVTKAAYVVVALSGHLVNVQALDTLSSARKAGGQQQEY